MDNILIEIYVPVVHQVYDVYIPLTKKLYEVDALLATALSEVSNGYFVASHETVLCDRESGEMLDINKSAIELGLRNGSKLMLI